MHKSFIILLLSLIYPFSSEGMERDTISIISDVYYNNPAINFYRHNSSQSFVGISGMTMNRDSYILQQGKGLRQIEAKASSWMPLNQNNKIWGYALYRNSTRKDVTWSETSDAELLYPYIMADSVGGNMKGQTYLFNGGYAGKINKIIFGAELGYRAQIEYRNVDPRPRNIISDLMIKAGTSYNTRHFQLGASLSYSSYNQKNDVDFYSQLGNAYMHTMTGLGNTYSRFDGTRTSAEYVGNNFGVSLQLRPLRNEGLWINAQYITDNKTRKLVSENYIPLTEMNNKSYSLTTAYRRHISSKTEVGIELNGTISKREGKENLFNSGNGSSMEVIGNRKPYSEDNETYNINLLYSLKANNRYKLSVKPSAGFFSSEMTHTDNAREMRYKRYSFGGEISNEYSFRSWLLDINAKGYYQPVNNAYLSVNGISNQSIKQMLENNYTVFTTDRNIFQLQAKAYIPLKATLTKLFCSLRWNGELYRNNLGNNNTLEVSTGILF